MLWVLWNRKCTRALSDINLRYPLLLLCSQLFLSFWSSPLKNAIHIRKTCREKLNIYTNCWELRWNSKIVGALSGTRGNEATIKRERERAQTGMRPFSGQWAAVCRSKRQKQKRGGGKPVNQATVFGRLLLPLHLSVTAEQTKMWTLSIRAEEQKQNVWIPRIWQTEHLEHFIWLAIIWWATMIGWFCSFYFNRQHNLRFPRVNANVGVDLMSSKLW